MIVITSPSEGSYSQFAKARQVLLCVARRIGRLALHQFKSRQVAYAGPSCVRPWLWHQLHVLLRTLMGDVMPRT